MRSFRLRRGYGGQVGGYVIAARSLVKCRACRWVQLARIRHRAVWSDSVSIRADCPRSCGLLPQFCAHPNKVRFFFDVYDDEEGRL
jgi:hypothetical protein